MKDSARALVDPTPIGYRQRLAMLRAGFKTESYALYDLAHNDPADYLPSAYWRPLSRVNGEAVDAVLGNKLLFYLTYREQLPLPAVRAFVAQGAVVPVTPGPTLDSPSGVLEHVASVAPLVVKPLRGDKGRGVHVLAAAEGGFLLDREPLTRAAALAWLGRQDGSLLVERVEQAEYARLAFPHAVNSLRLVVFGGAGAGEPFVAAAAHRFGRDSTVPVDNTSRGGVISGVDLETATLGPATRYLKGAARLPWYDDHPDSGVRLKGMVVPGLSEVVDALLAFSRRHPYLAYVGWDVVITETGFTVLEANHHAALQVQMFAPFLKDERIVAFLAYHGLLPPRVSH